MILGAMRRPKIEAAFEDDTSLHSIEQSLRDFATCWTGPGIHQCRGSRRFAGFVREVSERCGD